MMFRRKHNFLKARRFVWFRPEHPATGFARTGFFCVLAIGTTLVLLIAPFWFLSARVYTNADRGRLLLADAEVAAEKLDFATAITDTDFAEKAFIAARWNLKTLTLFSGIPILGPNIRAADRLLTSGISATGAARDVFVIGRDIVAVTGEAAGVTDPSTVGLPDPSTLFKDLSGEDKRRILAAFANATPKLTDALWKIDDALASFDQISTTELVGSFRDTLAPIKAKLMAMRAAIAAVQPLSGVLPGILGYPEAKHYLFFFENNTELRPTGGFLGVFGMLTVQDAEIAAMMTNDVYALDGPVESLVRPAPPAPIQKYLGINKWYLRDANWSPDFPTSAVAMMRLFREEASVAFPEKPVAPIDGIIAVTPKFAQDVLRLTGPIAVDGKTFTADNVVDELEFQVEQGFVKGGVPFNQRKDIVGKLVREVVARLSSFSLARLIEAVGTVDENIKEGHIIVYSADPSLQATIVANGWGGAVKSTNGDSLMVIDANLGALKTDAVIDRSLTYHIAPAKDGGYDGEVTMTYHNKGTFTWKTSRYRTYTRAYLPLGTTLTGSSGAMENDKLKDPGRHPGKVDVTDDLGRRVFGAFIAVEPGETKTLAFRFRLASSVVDAIRRGGYTLNVEKQAGTLANGLTLDLDFGKKLSNAEPPEERAHWGDTRYMYGTDLRIDRTFIVSF